MRLTKAERAAANPHVSYRRLLIEELIADERQRENTMTRCMKFNVSLLYGQVALDIEVVAEDDTGMTMDEIKSTVDSFIGQGFTPRTFQRAGQDSKMDKVGTVQSVKPVEGTKMYEVTGLLDDGAGEFKWKEFTATAFRKGDRFKVIKNDRGFFAGQLIIDDGEQQSLAF